MHWTSANGHLKSDVTNTKPMITMMLFVMMMMMITRAGKLLHLRSFWYP